MKLLCTFAALFLLFALAAGDDLSFPSYTHKWLTSKNETMKMPVWTPFERMTESLLKCPRADLLETLGGTSYSLSPVPGEPEYAYAISLWADYTDTFNDGHEIGFNPFGEMTYATLIESPNMEWYPWGGRPTEYQPFLYYDQGYRDPPFWESTPDKPSAEIIFKEMFGLQNHYAVDYVVNEYTEKKCDLEVYSVHDQGHHFPLLHIKYDATGYPYDPAINGTFYVFTELDRVPWAFFAEGQTTYPWQPDTDTFFINPLSPLRPYRNCQPLYVWHQAPYSTTGLRDYCWVYPPHEYETLEE